MSVAQKLSEEVIHLNFSDFPPNVIHQTKRLVLDTLGCAIGGFLSDASRAIRVECGTLLTTLTSLFEQK